MYEFELRRFNGLWETDMPWCEKARSLSYLPFRLFREVFIAQIQRRRRVLDFCNFYPKNLESISKEQKFRISFGKVGFGAKIDL